MTVGWSVGRMIVLPEGSHNCWCGAASLPHWDELGWWELIFRLMWRPKLRWYKDDRCFWCLWNHAQFMKILQTKARSSWNGIFLWRTLSSRMIGRRGWWVATRMIMLIILGLLQERKLDFRVGLLTAIWQHLNKIAYTILHSGKQGFQSIC